MANSSGSKPDLGAYAGVILGVGGIVGGLILEGGQLREIIAPTALLIVLGGTLGAVLISTPSRVLRGALRALRKVFVQKSEEPELLIEQIVEYSMKARKSGIVAL